METFEPKDDWQGKVSLSAPFSNPITRFMASFYLTSEQQNEQLRTHMEKVAFMPNYSVTAAQAIVPASDISEHIS